MPKKQTPDTVPLSSIKLNDGKHGLPKNPRFIRDDRFKALCDSVRDNPEYMPARPIIVNEAGVILGGNMRFRACKELGMKDIPAPWVQRVEGWPVEKQRRFIILDNRGFGEDDFDALGNDWDMPDLIAAGMEEQEILGRMEKINEELEAQNEEIYEQSIQMSPQDRFMCIIMTDADFEEAKQILELQMVRRGGYKE